VNWALEKTERRKKKERKMRVKEIIGGYDWQQTIAVIRGSILNFATLVLCVRKRGRREDGKKGKNKGRKKRG